MSDCKDCKEKDEYIQLLEDIIRETSIDLSGFIGSYGIKSKRVKARENQSNKKEI